VKRDSIQSCSVCGRQLQLKRLQSIRGRARDVRVTIQGLSVASCLGGHFLYATKDFGHECLTQLHEKIPHGSDALIPKRQRVCHQCGSQLNWAVQALTIPITITLQDLPPFNVIADLPGTTCRTCRATDVLWTRELTASLSDALIDALDCAEVRPS
jgi:hypothetical protein